MGESTEPKSVEESLARLEDIALLLDRNEVPLATALTLCTEAATLLRTCRDQLAEAEGKIEQLIEAANGEAHLVPFNNP